MPKPYKHSSRSALGRLERAAVAYYAEFMSAGLGNNDPLANTRRVVLGAALFYGGAVVKRSARRKGGAR